MKCMFQVTIMVFSAFVISAQGYKLMCYYDITSANRVGPAKFTSKDMELALTFCSHVVYSYVTIKPGNFTIRTLPHEMERQLARMQLFKNKYPNVRFLLSISGDKTRNATKLFLELLETDRHKKNIFIRSAMTVLRKYKFDGLSLDLPLPTIQPKTHVTWYNKMFYKVAKLFRKNSQQDSKHSEHKSQLTTLIQKLSTNLKEHHGLLALNVLPNVDSSKYFDTAEIIKNLDFVILSAFDFYTPQGHPKEADLISPAMPDGKHSDRLPLANIRNLYCYWHTRKVPRHKIILGAAAYGRSWKLTKKSNSNGVPPVTYTDGPAPAGPQTQTPGFLSWPEICQKLSHDPKLTRVVDAKAKSVYSFRPADIRGNFGIWISYEDPTTIVTKAKYVRNKNLGGVALFDLSLDDVHGECSGEKFPLLRSLKFKLTKHWP